MSSYEIGLAFKRGETALERLILVVLADGQHPQVPLERLAEASASDPAAVGEALGSLSRQGLVRFAVVEGVVHWSFAGEMDPDEPEPAGDRGRRKNPARRSFGDLVARDGGACHYCGAERVPLEVEHRLPVTRGGGNELDNLVLACGPCNRAKGTLTDEEFKRRGGRQS